MRWLKYLVVVLGLLATGLGIGSLRRADSGGPVRDRSTEPVLPDKEAAKISPVPGKGSITVEAEGLSPEEKQALGKAFHKIFEEAISRGLSNLMEENLQKLRINSDMERKLLAAADNWGGEGEEAAEPAIWAIHLIQPGKADQPSETIELGEIERFRIRYTRAFAAVEQPIAVATITYMVGRHIVQREQVLVFGKDGEWRSSRSTPKIEPRERRKE